MGTHNDDIRIYQLDKAFPTNNNLMLHNKPHQCCLCDKVFYTTYTLKKHLKLHIDHKPYQCIQSNKAFFWNSELKIHIRTLYRCTQCDKVFSKAGNFMIYMRMHNGDKRYQYCQCSKYFFEISNLKTHMRTHSGDNPYQFSQC